MADAAVEEHLALRLAHNDGWLADTDGWGRSDRSMRKDYLDLARTTLAVTGGPTEAQRQVAALDAEVRELKQQRDRYRDAWLSASRGRRRARRRTK
ncbi:hypothetical protein OHB14_36555 [Streptomyces sp. NBC_01613]|uniref:hypothetical protein n=1 Tax=Streptomyces sp. NBC_01613 TaxID=2975896 RepID=UPI0038657B88